MHSLVDELLKELAAFQLCHYIKKYGGICHALQYICSPHLAKLIINGYQILTLEVFLITQCTIFIWIIYITGSFILIIITYTI